MKNLALVLVLAPALWACVTPRAHTPIERPTLDVPPVPPRLIDPAPPPELPAIEPIAELPPEKSNPPPPKPRSSSPRDNSRETAKPEPPKTDLPPVEPAPATAPIAPPLRTAATADAAGADRRIRETLQRTQGILKGVDYQRLRQELRAEYDRAKDHIERAELALKELNFDLATEMANKAETLAKELQRR